MHRALPRKPFARGVALLVGGTAAAQALGVLATPMLTRLYSPDEFGVLAIYISLLSLCGVIASLRYEIAIPLPEDDSEAGDLVALSCILAAGMAFLAALLVWMIGDQLALLVGTPGLAPYLWLLPLGILFSGAYNIFRYWAIRTQRFAMVARTTLWQSIVMIVIQLAGYNFGAVGLLVGQAASQGLGSIALGRNSVTGRMLRGLCWPNIKKQAVRYKRFPIFSTWEGLFNTAGTQLPPLLFAVFFSPAAAGLYSLANRVLSLPMSLIGNAVGQAFFSNAAQAHREGRLGTQVVQLHSRLCQIGILPTLLLILAGPEIFLWAFGSDWLVAGEFSRWMAPWLYFVFVCSPLSTLFAVMEKQTQGMLFQIILLLSRLLAIYAGSRSGDMLSTVIWFSAASALCWIGFLLWIGYTTGNQTFEILKPTLSASWMGSVLSIPLAAAIYYENYQSGMIFYGLLLSAALMVIRVFYLVRKVY